MKYDKIIKWFLLALFIVGVVFSFYGFLVGFDTNGDAAVDNMLYCAYAYAGIAIAAVVLGVVVIGGINNPKSLLKLLLGLVAGGAVIAVAYVLAPGNPAFGREGQDPVSTLKLVDTVLNLTYFAGAATLISIVVGEIRLAITNKK